MREEQLGQAGYSDMLLKSDFEGELEGKLEVN